MTKGKVESNDKGETHGCEVYIIQINYNEAPLLNMRVKSVNFMSDV